MDVVLQIVAEALVLGLIVLLVLCAAAGAAVAVRPALMNRLKAATERRVSMRRATRPLDVPRNVDRLFYRHHRAYGATIVILAIFLLYVLSFGSTDAWHSVLSEPYREVGDILIDAGRIVLWLLTVFALVIGTVVFVRPSALKAFERWANRWLTPRRYTYPLEREYSGLDQRLQRYPRLWGTIVALFSVACIIALASQWPALAGAG